MSENIITDRKSAVALVKYERDRSKVVYADYIAANAVTLDSVADHVKALTEMAYPGFKKGDDAETAANRKSFMNRVRNGLNHTLRKWESDAASKEAPEASESAESDEGESGEPEGAPVTLTPVGAFLVAVEAFRAAGYGLSDARAVLADVFGSADAVTDEAA